MLVAGLDPLDRSAQTPRQRRHLHALGVDWSVGLRHSPQNWEIGGSPATWQDHQPLPCRTDPTADIRIRYHKQVGDRHGELGERLREMAALICIDQFEAATAL